MNDVKISVIIPAYNSESTIERCILSVIEQTSKDIEIIVIDDGSVDATSDIIKTNFGTDARVTLIKQANGGVSCARNRGLLQASGEYICFVDSDDVVDEQYIEILLDHCKEGVLPVGKIVPNGYLRVTSKGSPYEISINMDSLDEDYFIGELGKSIAFSACNKLFKRDILIKNNLFFDKEITMGEDMVFVYKYLHFCSKVVFDQNAIYNYIIRENSKVNALCYDYMIDYELLYNVLVNYEWQGKFIDKSILAKWTMSILPNILMNSFVVNKSYYEFKEYYFSIKKKLLVINAVSHRKHYSLKDLLIKFCINRKKSFYLFVLIKLKKLALVFFRRWMC